MPMGVAIYKPLLQFHQLVELYPSVVFTCENLLCFVAVHVDEVSGWTVVILGCTGYTAFSTCLKQSLDY